MLSGPKPPLQPKHVWAIRTHLQLAGKVRDLALFNPAVDSELRACDVVSLRVEDVAPHRYTIDRAAVRQRKTGRPVKFEITEQTRQAVDAYLAVYQRKRGQYLFAGRDRLNRGLSTRRYARLLDSWISAIGLDATLFGTHSIRRTKATLIYRRTGNLRAVQLLLGHTKVERTVRYLGVEVDDALRLAEQIDIRPMGQGSTSCPAQRRPLVTGLPLEADVGPGADFVAVWQKAARYHQLINGGQVLDGKGRLGV